MSGRAGVSWRVGCSSVMNDPWQPLPCVAVSLLIKLPPSNNKFSNRIIVIN